MRIRYFNTTHYFYSIILPSFIDLLPWSSLLFCSTEFILFFSYDVAAQSIPWYPYSWEFCHTHTHNDAPQSIGLSLDEWSVRRRDLYLSTHNTQNRHTSMPPVGFKPTISAGEQPQTYALDRAVNGTGSSLYTPPFTSKNSLCYTFFLTHILTWSEFWIFVDFRSCVSETAFLLWYDTTSMDTLLQVFRDMLIVCNSQETIIQWHSVTSQKNGTFCVLYAQGELWCSVDNSLSDLLV